MTSPYKYHRIDLATDAIRLVKLFRADQGEPIQCEIFETYLHQVDGVPYEALSYVWGARQSADEIWLDGCLFKVTQNLYEALVHLRRPDEDRLLWIDAICIDQSHNAVSNHVSWPNVEGRYCVFPERVDLVLNCFLTMASYFHNESAFLKDTGRH